MERVVLRVEQFLVLAPAALVSVVVGILVLYMQFTALDWISWFGYYTVPFFISAAALASTFIAIDEYLSHGFPGLVSETWYIGFAIICVGVVVALGPVAAVIIGTPMPWMDKKGSFMFGIGIPAVVPAGHALYLLVVANKARHSDR